MGSVWCVEPEDVRVDLTWETPDGEQAFWVRFKKQLNIGEDRAYKTAGLTSVSRPAARGIVDEATSEVKVDWRATGVVRLMVWLTDWSLTDDKDRKLPLKREVVDTLHVDVFTLIENALTAHVEALEAQKKIQSGTRRSEPLRSTMSG